VESYGGDIDAADDWPERIQTFAQAFRGRRATEGRLIRSRKGARRHPAGSMVFFFNWTGRLSLSRCSSALRGTDLCEHREHVEVVRAALDLAVLDLDDLACRHLYRLV
jgi:hypothetical protein